jgi:mono/diheme cytochrome c family protein
MRHFFIIYGFAVLLGMSVMGLRGCKTGRTPIELFPDMDRQAKLHPQGQSAFFADGRADRPPVAGTVPAIAGLQTEYAHLQPDSRFREDSYLVTGKLADGTFGAGFPIEVNHENMLRGRELYTIHCTACHGATGNGQGVVADERYGFNTIISILQTRIVDQPEGELYNTVNVGKNTMFGYGAKIRVEDRWKVVLYMRALQRAANATTSDVPADKRGELGI